MMTTANRLTAQSTHTEPPPNSTRNRLGVYDRISWEFVRWIYSFRTRQRPRILDLLGMFDGELIVLQSRRDVRRFLASLGEAGVDVGPSGKPGRWAFADKLSPALVVSLAGWAANVT
jgi:hypothetical protein